MNIIADKFEINLNHDGQVYGIVFEGRIGDSPRRCEIFLSGCLIGEATWYDGDGLLDRFPDSEGNPPQFWRELCDQLESTYEYMLRAVEHVQKTPWFTTDGHKLHFEHGEWTDGTHTFSAQTITGHPIDADGNGLDGTYHTNKPRG
jgi:hypothetical protein